MSLTGSIKKSERMLQQAQMSQTTNTLSNQLKQDEILSMKDSRVIATSKPTVPEKTPFKKQMVNMKSQLLNHDIDVSPNFDLCITGQ